MRAVSTLRRSWPHAKYALAWFVAGVGWDLQSRVLDGVLDRWFAASPWLAWLVQ